MNVTSGWVMFAGMMLVLAALLKAIFGLVAVFNSEWVVFTPDGAWLVDTSAWGWITLLLSLVLFLAAFGVFSGQTWARIVGIVAATVAAVDAFAIASIYPVWGLSIFAIAVFVIYGLAVHGDEVAVT